MTNELREERDELKSEVANLKKELEQQKLNAGPDIEQDMVKWVCAEVESKNDGGNEAHSKAMEEVEQLRLEASEKETYIEDLRQRVCVCSAGYDQSPQHQQFLEGFVSLPHPSARQSGQQIQSCTTIQFEKFAIL